MLAFVSSLLGKEFEEKVCSKNSKLVIMFCDYLGTNLSPRSQKLKLKFPRINFYTFIFSIKTWTVKKKKLKMHAWDSKYILAIVTVKIIINYYIFAKICIQY